MMASSVAHASSASRSFMCTSSAPTNGAGLSLLPSSASAAASAAFLLLLLLLFLLLRRGECRRVAQVRSSSSSSCSSGAPVGVARALAVAVRRLGRLRARRLRRCVANKLAVRHEAQRAHDGDVERHKAAALGEQLFLLFGVLDRRHAALRLERRVGKRHRLARDARAPVIAHALDDGVGALLVVERLLVALFAAFIMLCGLTHAINIYATFANRWLAK